MGSAERHSQPHQSFGKVGRHESGVRGSLFHLLPFEHHGCDHGGIDREDLESGINGIKESHLILLEIPVVGKGQTFAHSEQSVEGSGEAGSLAPGQLADIGILLLGHET